MYIPRAIVETGDRGRVIFTFNDDDPGMHDLRRAVGEKNFHSFRLQLLMWVALLGDSPVDKKPKDCYTRFIKSFCSDPFGVLSSYSRLANDLYDNFIRSDAGTSISTGFLTEFKNTPIFREYLEFYRKRDPSVYRYINTFLLFGKKVQIEDTDLEASALRAWLEIEAEMGSLTLPSWTTNLKRILHVLLEGYQPEHFLPKHGSGSVSERNVHGTRAKNAAFGLSPRLDITFYRSYPVRGFEPNTPLPALGVPYHPTLPNPTSRLMFVAKSWKSYRSICMEPIAHQWAQQGVRLWLEQAMRTGLAKRFLNLADQGDNQLLAQLGSKTGWCSTIDLSAASDRVHIDLVRAVFPNTVLLHLLGTRSEAVELPDGTHMHPHKFAPMGSAVCFPVQSLIFLSVVLMASLMTLEGDTLESLDLSNWSDSQLKDAIIKLYPKTKLEDFALWPLAPVRVYGDDIICDNTITSNVMDALESLGFQVNREKSFFGVKCFRESCGKHFFLGYDVSPMILKLKGSSRKVSVTELSSIVDAANRAGEYGYLTLRKHLIQCALYTPVRGVSRSDCIGGKNPILFSQDKDSPLSIHTAEKARNPHLKYREWSTSDERSTAFRYQRDELRVLAVGPARKVKPSSKDDGYYLTCWWRSRYPVRNDSPGAIKSDLEISSSVWTTESLDTRARLVWVPA